MKKATANAETGDEFPAEEVDTSVFALDKIPVDERDEYWRKHIYRADKEPQLTLRAAIFGGCIGVLALASSLYTTLKIGWGFGMALVAVVLAYVVFNTVRSISGGRVKAMGILETAATSSVTSVTGLTPTHTVVSAFGALMLIQQAPTEWYKMVPIIFFAATLGTLIGIPIKRSLINQERLRFPSAIASAETLKSLYAKSDAPESKNKVRTLLGALVFGAILGLIKSLPELAAVLAEVGKKGFASVCEKLAVVPGAIGLPDFLNPLAIWGVHGQTVMSDAGVKGNVPADSNLPGVSIDPSVLLIGAGMLCGMRVSLTMFLTAVALDWWIAPWLISQDILHVAAGGDFTRNIEAIVNPETGFKSFRVVYWSLWCGTAIMVMSSFTSLAFQWKTIGRAFSGAFGKNKVKTEKADPLADLEVPMKWFFIGIVPVSVGLICTLHFAFETQWYLGIFAIFLAGMFGLICARSCGEADTNPIGAMGKISQLIYSVMPGARGNINTNLITGGVTAAAGGAAGDLMSDMKLGNLLGMKPRIQFWTQILAICIGTAIVVPVWNLLVPDVATLEAYSPPPATMWKAVAEFLNSAGMTLPTTVKVAMAIGALIGVAIPVCERLFPKARPYLPSAIGMGIVLTLPSAFANAASFAIGAIIVWLWNKIHTRTEERYSVALASGLVAGESIAMALFAMGATAILQLADHGWL